MFVRRGYRSVIAAFGLAVLLLAAYAVQVQSGPPAQISGPPYIYHLPRIFNTQALVITGTVTNNNAAAPGETVLLMLSRDGGLNYTEQAQTVTNSTGGYRFEVPANSPNDRFYAAWRNRSNGAGKLWGFKCTPLTITSPNRACDFDVKDVPLIAPSRNAAVNFPLTFQWTPRGLNNTDNYAVVVYRDEAGTSQMAISTYVGYTDRITLETAPDPAQTGTRYYWSVRFQTPSGIGDAYAVYGVTFNDLNRLGVQSASGPVWEVGENSRLKDP